MPKKIALVFIVSSMFLTVSAIAEPSNDAYRLVWADEFEEDGRPDPKNWDYEHGFVRNEELQWYQEENAFCEDGRLIIEARRERKRNKRYRKNSNEWRRNREFAEYTSACLMTRNLHSWQYGRFEVKARIKTADGLWPAIWFLGVEGRWPYNGEIDLMEYYENSILANTCWGVWDSEKVPVESFGDPKWEDKFHVWRMDWDRDSIKLYLDDKLLNSTDLAETVNPGMQPENPFHQPHYLLINLAIGGNRGGDPSNTSFPTRYEIEYVRVFQKMDDGE